MRVLVAPDKFKGSLSAADVADHLAKGLAEAGVDAVTLPLADGGDGSVAAAIAAGFQPHHCTVTGAVGQRRSATIAINDVTAVIEVANTCGLATLPAGMQAPMIASSYGFGEAIRHAVGLGMRKLVLALGGSASTDGGTGLLAALGYQFADSAGQAVEASAQNLHQIHEIRGTDAVDLTGVELIIASDVTNPLTGSNGAAAVFGAQKGATPADIDRLDAGLDHLLDAVARSGWPDARALAATPGAGAAGGCGLAAILLGATVVSGADYFLDLLGFDEHMRNVDLVITGEGRLDSQTLAGKLPAAVARRAGRTPVIAVVGRNDLAEDSPVFAEIYPVTDLSDADTAHDTGLTSVLLRRIGADIGHRTSDR